jgi:probable rRNA maturation factor
VDNIVLIKHNKNWGLDEERVRSLARKALDQLGLKENIELSVIFVGRRRAKKLNQEYRKKDYIPQVLGFPMDKEKGIDGWTRLGDVVICTERLKEERADVLYEWLIHGIRNLLI